MGTYVKGSAVANATSYELLEKTSGSKTLVSTTVATADAYTQSMFYRPAGTSSSNSSYRATELIDITDCVDVAITTYIKTVSVAPVVWFDADKNYLSGETLTSEQATGEMTVEYNVPSGAKYAAFSSQNYSGFEPSVTAHKYESAGGDSYSVLATASEINFEVSAMGLAAGDHVLVVKAKADGYTDSDYSNEVTYTAT